MKKTILFAALLASTATFATAQDGGPGPQGPRFGGPRFGQAFKDGKLEIAKLPEQMPQERKDKMKAADKDGDGFLTAEEMKELAPKFEKPAFMTDDKKIDVAKLTEAIKAADKNNDGFIDQDERKNLGAVEARKAIGTAARVEKATVRKPIGTAARVEKATVRKPIGIAARVEKATVRKANAANVVAATVRKATNRSRKPRKPNDRFRLPLLKLTFDAPQASRPDQVSATI